MEQKKVGEGSKTNMATHADRCDQAGESCPHIVWLDVAVHDALAVAVVQGLQQLKDVVAAAAARDSTQQVTSASENQRWEARGE